MSMQIDKILEKHIRAGTRLTRDQREALAVIVRRIHAWEVWTWFIFCTLTDPTSTRRAADASHRSGRYRVSSGPHVARRSA